MKARIFGSRNLTPLTRDSGVPLMSHPDGRKVLLVEDESSIAQMIDWALERAGYRAIVGKNGSAGLEAFLQEPSAIDLVLTDVVMPRMDGITMVQEIRKVRPTIPVLFMSSHLHKVVSISGTKFPLIHKPFLLEDLIRVINEILDHSPSVAN